MILITGLLLHFYLTTLPFHRGYLKNGKPACYFKTDDYNSCYENRLKSKDCLKNTLWSLDHYNSAVHFVVAVVNCGLCVRRCLASSSYTHVMQCHFIYFTKTPMPRMKLCTVADVDIETKHHQRLNKILIFVPQYISTVVYKKTLVMQYACDQHVLVINARVSFIQYTPSRVFLYA